MGNDKNHIKKIVNKYFSTNVLFEYELIVLSMTASDSEVSEIYENHH